METAELMTAENVALVIAFSALMIALAISIVKDRLGTAMFVTIAAFGIGYFSNSIDKSLISKVHLAGQINPSVPTRGYKWVDVKALVLYKDGKLEKVMLYEK